MIYAEIHMKSSYKTFSFKLLSSFTYASTTTFGHHLEKNPLILRMLYSF